MSPQCSEPLPGTVLIDNSRYLPVDRLLFKSEIDGLLQNPDFFSHFSVQSKVDVFEVRRSGGNLLPSFDDDTILKYLEGMSDECNADVVSRMIFIGGQKTCSDQINATAKTFKSLCDSLSVSSTFIALMPTQQMPGASILRHPTSKQPLRHDMCYSLISRSRDRRNQKEAEKYRRESFPTYYASKSVIEWSRMNVWACHDLVNHTSTALIVRCPDHLMTSFVSTFSGEQGRILLQHPTLLHTYFCSDYLTHSYDFLGAFSEDIYDLENGGNRTVDPTTRSQKFLNLIREVSQVATDYKIMGEAIRMLKREHFRLKDVFSTTAPLNIDEAQSSDGSTHYFNDEIFDQFLTQTEMIQTYSNLYNKRAKIGVNEGFALATQRDANINIRIAEAAYRDGKALQSIQYLTMIFLPPSLAAAILGMGFFSTSSDNEGSVVFNISNRWWIFLAVSGCLLIVMAIIMFFLRRHRICHPAPITVDEKV